MNTLNDLAFFQFGLGNSTNTVGGKVGVSGLDATEAAQVFIALLLPLGNKVTIGDLVLQAIVVQFCNNDKNLNTDKLKKDVFTYLC